MTAPARHNHVFHGLKKPEIAYLPTACAETLPFPPPTVLSCYPIWDGNRGDSRDKRSNPHTFLCMTWSQGNPWPTSSFAHLPLRHGGLDPAIHVLGGQSPDRARLAPRLSGDGIEASFAYFNSTLAPAFSS